MRLTLALCRRRLQNRFRLFDKVAPGNIYTGKHQVKRVIGRYEIQNMMRQLAIEEETMKYLRTPYLTTAEETAYVSVCGKDAWMADVRPEPEVEPIKHRTTEEMLEHVKLSNPWE